MRICFEITGQKSGDDDLLWNLKYGGSETQIPGVRKRVICKSLPTALCRKLIAFWLIG